MRLAIGVLITTALLNHSAGIPRFPTFWSPRASKLFLSRYLSETVRCQSCYNYNGQACVSNPDCYGEFCLFGSCTSIDGPCSNVYSAKNCQMYSFFFCLWNSSCSAGYRFRLKYPIYFQILRQICLHKNTQNQRFFCIYTPLLLRRAFGKGSNAEWDFWKSVVRAAFVQQSSRFMLRIIIDAFIAWRVKKWNSFKCQVARCWTLPTPSVTSIFTYLRADSSTKRCSFGTKSLLESWRISIRWWIGND